MRGYYVLSFPAPAKVKQIRILWFIQINLKYLDAIHHVLNSGFALLCEVFKNLCGKICRKEKEECR